MKVPGDLLRVMTGGNRPTVAAIARRPGNSVHWVALRSSRAADGLQPARPHQAGGRNGRTGTPADFTEAVVQLLSKALLMSPCIDVTGSC